MNTNREVVGWRSRLYVGAPNSNHKISVKYAKRIHNWAASVKLRAYTVYPAMGCWEGQPEETAVIEVLGHRITKKMISALRAALGQQAIYMTKERIRSAIVS